MNQLETIWQQLQHSMMEPVELGISILFLLTSSDKDLSARQASVTQPLHCVQPKIFCYMWTPAGNLPTQRRGLQVGAMLLSLTEDVPLCSLVKPTLK